MQLHCNMLNEHTIIERRMWQLFSLEPGDADDVRGEVDHGWLDIKVGSEWAVQ